MNTDLVVVKIDRALAFLAEAKDLQDVKQVMALALAAKVYAKQVSASLETINRASEIRLRAERKLGEMLKSSPKATGTKNQLVGRGVIGGATTEPPIDTPTLAEAGISKKLSSRAQQLAAIPVEDFEAALIVPEGDELSFSHVQNPPNRTQSTGNIEWYTPEKFIEAARDVLAGIDMDPASSKAANKVVKAQRIFTVENNGLEQEWSGTVWLNPPYSQPLMSEFVRKLVQEYKAGHVSESILLTNNSTETGWFQHAAEVAAGICFPSGRISFDNPAGASHTPLQGQAFFYFGHKLEWFCANFSQFGLVLRRAAE